MKTTHTEEQMQAAIDAALVSSNPIAISCVQDTIDWDRQANDRRDLLKSAIKRLPDPPPPVVDGKTPGEVYNELARADEGFRFMKWSDFTEEEKAVENKRLSAVLAAFGGEWKARAEKAEAELAKRVQELWAVRQCFSEASHADCQSGYVISDLVQQIKSLQQPQLSTLRPIAEAGDVPAGCVRVWGVKYRSGGWMWNDEQSTADTHFADIHLPESPKPEAAEIADPYAELKAAHAAGKVIEYRDEGTNGEWKTCNYSPGWFMKSEYRIKPEPETFTAHGKTWTRHTPGDPMPCDGEERMVQVLYDAQEGRWREDTAEGVNWKKGTSVTGWRYADEPTPEPVKPWTPKVGDVVRLKSGGPKMTVHELFPEEDRVICYHYKKGRLETPTFATATLTPA